MITRYYGSKQAGEIDPKWLVIELFDESIIRGTIEPTVGEFETNTEAYEYYNLLIETNRYLSKRTIILAKIVEQSITLPVWESDEEYEDTIIKPTSSGWIAVDVFEKIERNDIDTTAFVFDDHNPALKKYQDLKDIRNEKEYFSNIYLGEIICQTRKGESK